MWFHRCLLSTVMLVMCCGLTSCTRWGYQETNDKVKPGPTDPDAPSSFSETNSGLKYRILRKSDGPKPTPRDEIVVHYKGWLDDGEIIDNSYEEGRPQKFTLGRVIHGWTEGIGLIGEGGMVELEIPAYLGYGAAGRGSIPPDARLHFIVELLKVIPGSSSGEAVDEHAGHDHANHDHGAAEPGPTDEDAPEEFTTTASGLKYRVLRESDGEKPSRSSTVTVHYRGWLDDGTEFDSSYKRGKPTTFGLGGVIPGWTEGLQLVGEGGMIELEIPYGLAYGPEGKGPIPPKATLHFIVELVDVK